MFLYSAVSSPLDHSKRFTLVAPPDRPVHSDSNSASPGSILARQQLHAKTQSLTFPPLSIARFSFIQLSQQGRQWREQKCPIVETVAKGIRTRAHLIVSPAFYHGATAIHEYLCPVYSHIQTLAVARLYTHILLFHVYKHIQT